MKAIEKIRKYLQINLSPPRYQHSLGVEQMSLKLAHKFKIDSGLCALAGLSHDICREMSKVDLERISGKVHENFVLLHGYAGANLLQRQFGINNQPVLDAIRYHTSGNAGLDAIGKIVFAADYMEPGRVHLDDVMRNRLLLLDLDAMVLSIALSTKMHLEMKNLVIEPEMGKMIQELTKE